MKTNYKAGDRVGPWTLDSQLGSGGNAEVWLADKNGEQAAVKILFSKKVASEHFRRFVREIEFAEKASGVSGVLPVLEHSLPEKPERKNPAWLAMPVATPIAEALTDQPLEVVVDAAASLARTLATLLSDFEASHRDLKPSNLYKLNDQWCLGDFGLVQIKTPEDLTAEGRTIGPVYFLAPEVLAKDEPIDYSKADVCSFAKTVWVLAIEQSWPPMVPAIGNRIQDFVPGKLAERLDALVEACTLLDPALRPTMEGVVDQLATALVESPTTPTGFDLSSLSRELNRKMAPSLTAQANKESWTEGMHEVVEKLNNALEPLATSLSDAFPNVSTFQYDDFARKWLETSQVFGGSVVIESEFYSILITDGDEYTPRVFRVAWGVELIDPGKIRLSAFVQYGFETQTGGDQTGVIEKTAPVGTAQIELEVQSLVEEITHLVPDWLTRYGEFLPEPTK